MKHVNKSFDSIIPFISLPRICGPLCMLARWMAINADLPTKLKII
jgi:hypothetical protein